MTEQARLERRRKAEASRRRKGRRSIMDIERERADKEMTRQLSLDEMLEKWDEPESIATEEDAIVAANAKKKHKSAVMKILTVLLIAILAVTLGTAFNMMSLLKQRDIAADRIAELQQQKSELELQMAEVGTESYMEKYARNWLKMTKSGEIVYKFGSEDGSSAVSEAAAEENSAVSQEKEGN